MNNARSNLVLAVLTLLLIGTQACGGGSSPAPSPTPTPTPQPTPGGTPAPATATVTITSAGVDPKEVTIRVGGRVTFINQNAAPHDMSSDPHPTHVDCPPMNAVGFLAANQTKETAEFPIARTCGFHDHNQPSNASLQGRVVIQ